MMLLVNGVVKDARVRVELCPRLDHGPMPTVHAIVLHQTDSPSAASTLNNKYRNPKAERTGAHFLLDKDGTMYQTLAVNRRCAQVAPIMSRCLAEHTCTPADIATYKKIEQTVHSSWNGAHNRAVGAYEAKKPYPIRSPWNPDSIGIEVVGLYLASVNRYEDPTPKQNVYLHWFVRELMTASELMLSDIYRHPQLSAKQGGEAAGITW